MKFQYTNRKRRSRIELRREEQCPLGISITESQKNDGRFIIKNIKHGSVAQKSHCLAEGDVILFINGKDTRSMRKKDVKRLLKDNQPLDIEVEYLSREASSSKIHCSQRTFLTLKKENGSFGFLVRKDVTEYPLISNIKRNGAADRDGSVMAGDRLLEVDNHSLSWISLTEVAAFLQEKDEAVFLIEYNVGIVSLSQKEIEIEIDCIDTNLGMALDTFGDDPFRMYIASIQQGGLTHRCGAFHIGDEVISIDDVEIKNLPITKANELLRRFRKKPGKLKISQRKVSTLLSQENLTLNNSKTESTADLGVEQISYGELSSEYATSQTISIGNEFSTKCSISSEPNCLSENNFFLKSDPSVTFNDNQLKALSILRHINLNIADMQLTLSRKDRKDFEVDSIQVNPGSCGNLYFVETENIFPKLKSDCLTIRNLTRELSFHYIKNIAQLELCQNEICTHKFASQEINSLANKTNFIGELVCHLKEILACNFISKKSVEKLLEAINAVNTNCVKCQERCYSVLFAVKKVLLLLSLNNQNSEVSILAQKVLSQVTEISIPCEDCKISNDTKFDNNSPGLKFCSSSLFEPSNCSSASNINNEQDASSIDIQQSESIFEPHVGLDIAHQKALYHLTEIQSSERSCSTTEDTIDYTQRKPYFQSSNMAACHSPKCDLREDSKSNSRKSLKFYHDNQQQKDQSTSLKENSWKSSQIISSLREELEQNFPSVILNPKSSKAPTPEKTYSNHKSNDGNRRSFGIELTAERSRNSRPDVRPRFTATEIDETNKQTHTEIHNVILKADENGFGLALGYDSIVPEESVKIPIIIAIKPKSPAGRIGLLKTGDRVLAMNGRSTENSSLEDLEVLKRQTFSLDEMTLTVEFDINEPVAKSGTFEITLDGTLKPGLVMGDSSCPSVVKGLVKGSAAHRSGQIFRGDIILVFGSIKKEDLDLQSWTKTKNKMFHLVVRRELDEAQVPVNISPEYLFDPVSLVRKGTYFNLKRTSVRTLEGYEGSNKVFLEQEFTLFRDPRTWEFGFRFGVDARTGKSFITGIRPGSPAANSKAIKENDMILEINGVLVYGSRENSVMNLIKDTSDHITLVTQRILYYR